MQRRLKIDKNFKPCLTDDGDEVYANGVFKFNISKMIAYIHNNTDVFAPEIAPDQYNLIDGHHRAEKAVRL